MKKLLLSFGVLMVLGSSLYAESLSQVPSDKQEKLAWGLVNFNSQAIEEAIDSEANPFSLHQTEVVGSSYSPDLDWPLMIMVNSYLDPMVNSDLDPYVLIFYMKNRLFWDISSYHAGILKNTETMLKKGITVEKSFRFFVNTMLTESQCNGIGSECHDGCVEDTLEGFNVFVLDGQKYRETRAELHAFAKELLVLIEKYQPGYNYALDDSGE